MQDEVNTKVVAIMIKGGKISAEVLKKALDMQAVSAATMIDAMQQSMPQPALATSGTLGTQVNTFA